MVCEDCRSVFYSAAAKTLVEQGDPCPKCGGRLLLEDEPRPGRVGVGDAGNGANGEE
jgi:rRNA maturation endonuclease Nob1